MSSVSIRLYYLSTWARSHSSAPKEMGRFQAGLHTWTPNLTNGS